MSSFRGGELIVGRARLITIVRVARYSLPTCKTVHSSIKAATSVDKVGRLWCQGGTRRLHPGVVGRREARNDGGELDETDTAARDREEGTFMELDAFP